MDRKHMQEVINGMRKIVKPYLAKQLKKINFEGCGNTDKAEFETDFEIVLTLAEKALAIPPAEPYKGMTNGEVIKSLFPNGRVLNKDECIGFENIFDDGTSYCSFFDGIWWNSPYKGEAWID